MSDIEPGATGNYPHGSLGPHDEGELHMTVAGDAQGNVHVKFGKPVAWFALPPDKAIGLARMIAEQAGASRVEIEL